MDYREYIAGKVQHAKPSGFDCPPDAIPSMLFHFQRDIVGWTTRMGRCALFADTGLGKGPMALTYANATIPQTEMPALFLTPLAVGPQIVKEAAKFGIPNVRIAESQSDVIEPGIWVTNYQKLHKFNCEKFGAIVGDESSIIKDHAGKTRNALLDFVAGIRYRLFCTATPAPNDHEELGNHAELLGIMTRAEMLSTFFIHDSGNTSEWRLKGHAEAEFWKWVASWAILIRKPSDLGYENGGYDLPPLNIVEHFVDSAEDSSRLFAIPASTLTEQRTARRQTLSARIDKAAELAKGKTPCLIWCELNDEADQVADKVAKSVQVAGADKEEDKIDRLNGFAEGRYKTLVTKPKIAGHGLNLQICNRMVFVGLSHSYEQFYQSVRRCWRFGQTKSVDVHIISSESESAILENIKQKQKDHERMVESMIVHTRDVNRAALKGTSKMSDTYKTDEANGLGWKVYLGDCVERSKEIADESIDYTIFSPPFAQLYTYSNSPRDMGNCRNEEEFFDHFKFLVPELLRVTKPGRLLSFHCMNLPTSLQNHGVIGLRDFRGELIKVFVDAGWVFHSEVCVWKDPVTAMQRTKALGLLHAQIKKDSCRSRQGIPDYVVTMRKPGVNPDPVEGRFDRYVGDEPPEETDNPERYSIEVWQRYASPVWMDINQSRTLNNYREGREEQDERHVCPLQLDLIERCLELWTNPGDTVLSPFTGIGSEGHQSLLLGRKFVGIELKESYFNLACRNLANAVKQANQKTLIDMVEPELVSDDPS